MPAIIPQDCVPLTCISEPAMPSVQLCADAPGSEYIIIEVNGEQMWCPAPKETAK